MSPTRIASFAVLALAQWLAGCSGLPAQAPAPAGAVSAPMPHAEPASGPSRAVRFDGAVMRPQSLDVAALQALPATTVTAGGHAYTGASLWAVLKDGVGIRGSRPKNPTVAICVVASGTDGYRVVIALGELDPEFGNRTALLAYAMDGAPLGRTGAIRLVLPDDVKMARSVANLDHLSLNAIDDRP